MHTVAASLKDGVNLSTVASEALLVEGFLTQTNVLLPTILLLKLSYSLRFTAPMLGKRSQSPSSSLGSMISPMGRITSSLWPDMPKMPVSRSLLESPFLLPPPPRIRGERMQHSGVLKLMENAPNTLSLMAYVILSSVSRSEASMIFAAKVTDEAIRKLEASAEILRLEKTSLLTMLLISLMNDDRTLAELTQI